MRFETPHPIPYQGSKRLLAPAILSFVPPQRFRRLVEPFAGSAAITLAAAQKNLFREYVIADILKPLTDIWRAILNEPSRLSAAYRELWESQLRGDPIDRFNAIRNQFNCDHDPAKLLFLLARCVKNAVRFSTAGQFNQSADKRRRGTHPDTMGKEIEGAHRVLSGRCEVVCGDFRSVLSSATDTDLIYMDPPYQGTSEGRDRRYINGVARSSMVKQLEDLTARRIEYLLSYDGHCGGKTYGEALPAHLNAHRVLLEVGRSSQATLNGKEDVTVESVYLSPGLADQSHPTRPVPLKQFGAQAALFS
ncbi:MAG: DNA adenine methylase [Acidobacteriia bacterium]|nr:DNA adenine methylase [Terriglobia bacterium]